jgi:hypothetical protein
VGVAYPIALHLEAVRALGTAAGALHGFLHSAEMNESQREGLLSVLATVNNACDHLIEQVTNTQEPVELHLKGKV